MDTHLDLSLYDVEDIRLSKFQLEGGSWIVSLIITEHNKYPHRLAFFCPEPQIDQSLVKEGPAGTNLVSQHGFQAIKVKEVAHLRASDKPFVTVKLDVLSEHGDWGLVLYTYQNSELGLHNGQILASTPRVSSEEAENVYE